MTKVVQLSDEAYARLRMMKGQGESFSDVVLRLTGRRDLSGLKGLRPAKELDEAESFVASIDALDQGA